MHRKDFMRLSGADQGTVEYLPIALLLSTGYGCAGYYNTSMNHALEDLIVLLNCRLIDLRNRDGTGPVITDFNEFLVKVVFEHYKSINDSASVPDHTTNNRGTIPLAAISLSDVAVFYPVEQISRLMRLIQKNRTIGQLIQPLHMGEEAATSQPVAPPVAARVETPVAAPTTTTSLITPAEVAASTAVVAPPASLPADAVVVPATSDVSPPADAPTQLAPMDSAPLDAAPLAELAAVASNSPAQPTAAKANQEQHVPTFLDFNHKSVVLAVLRTKLW